MKGGFFFSRRSLTDWSYTWFSPRSTPVSLFATVKSPIWTRVNFICVVSFHVLDREISLLPYWNSRLPTSYTDTMGLCMHEDKETWMDTAVKMNPPTHFENNAITVSQQAKHYLKLCPDIAVSNWILWYLIFAPWYRLFHFTFLYTLGGSRSEIVWQCAIQDVLPGEHSLYSAAGWIFLSLSLLSILSLSLNQVTNLTSRG